jgi:hypothetical protein
MITTFKSESYTIAVEKNYKVYKIFKIFFGKDGTLYINFPYYKYRQGLLCIAKLRKNLKPPMDVSLLPGGKLTSYYVKYSHHLDGNAAFSQDKKIFTIKKMSVPLRELEGHIFTIQLQGLLDFEEAKEKEIGIISVKKIFIKFPIKENKTIKFVGQWYLIDKLKWKKEGMGLIVDCTDPRGNIYKGSYLLSPNKENPLSNYVLLLNCKEMPLLSKTEPSTLTFIGGFDRKKIVDDLRFDTKFLAFMYPEDDFDKLKKSLELIDFSP